MQKPKVLFIAHVESHILNFHLPYLKLFQQHNYEVHVAANGTHPIPYCDAFFPLPFERTPFHVNNLLAYHQLKKLITTQQYTLIHCHTPVGGVLGRLAAKHLKQTQVFYTAHGFHFYQGAPLINHLLYRTIECMMAPLTDCLITINEEDYQAAQRFHVRTNGRVVKVNGVGIDLTAIDHIQPDRSSTRSRKGFSDTDKLLLSAGELNKNKNHELLIHAMANLTPKERTHLKLLICGEGKERTRLHAMIHEANLSEHIFLLGYRRDLIELMKISDAFIFPSQREGLSVALMQAIACGLPCILSDIRGNRDLKPYATSMSYFNPDNVQELTEILRSYSFPPVLQPRVSQIKALSLPVILHQM